MTKLARLLFITPALPLPAGAQSGSVVPADNLVTDGLPPVPTAIADAARPYVTPAPRPSGIGTLRCAGCWSGPA
jgi:hypothetical protein